MTCIEILRSAVEKEKNNPIKKKIGSYLLKRMATDTDLANAWEEKGLDLDFAFDCVRAEAQRRAVNGCYAFDEQEAYDFAVHSILETSERGKQPQEENEAEVEDEAEEEKKVEEKKNRKKAKGRNEGSLGMQMCLDDLDSCI